MPRSDITDGEIHDTASFAENARRYRCMPGIVVAYHAPVVAQSPYQPASPASVDVQPAVHDVRFCTVAGVPSQPAGVPPLIDGQRYSEPWPVLYRVPIAFPTFGGFAMWGPLRASKAATPTSPAQPPDRVILIGFDLDPSTFLATGQPSDPPMTRRNAGLHWLAIPADLTDPGALPDPGQAMCLGQPGGMMVAVTPGAVNLGSVSPLDAVALASKIDALNTLLGDFANAMGTVAAVGPLAPLADAVAAAVALAQGIPATVASSKVKCEP